MENTVKAEIMKHLFLVYAHFILVPLSYLKIALFLRHQNHRIGGNNDHNYCIAFHVTVLLIVMTRNTQNINGRRRQKNVVSIAYNLLAWCLDVLGDLLGLMVRSWDYHLAMVLVIICSSGLTPVIYLIGGRDYYSRATSSGEKNFVKHILHLIRGMEGV